MDLTPEQRDDTIRRLHLAAADGRLTLDEASERIASARSATTPEALQALVNDLGAAVSLPASPSTHSPVSAPTGQVAQFEPYPTAPEPVAVGKVSNLIEPGYSPNDPLILSAGWEGIKRTGSWRVPPFIRANSGVDSVKIDCLLAEHTSPVINLEVTAGAGSVKLIVPEGWGVQTDRLTKSFGSARSTVPTVPAPGYPLVVVHGGVGLGSFRARHANRWERWRLKRQGIELPPAPSRELR